LVRICTYNFISIDLNSKRTELSAECAVPPEAIVGQLWFCFLCSVGFSVQAVGEGPDLHVTGASECTNHQAVHSNTTMVALFELFHLIIALQQVGLA